MICILDFLVIVKKKKFELASRMVSEFVCF